MISIMFWLIFIQLGIFCAVTFLLISTFIFENKAERIFEMAKVENDEGYTPVFGDGRSK